MNKQWKERTNERMNEWTNESTKKQEQCCKISECLSLFKIMGVLPIKVALGTYWALLC